MATQLFLRPNGDPGDVPATADTDDPLALTRGSGLLTPGVATVAGPTAGVQLAATSWWYHVDAVTISGTITMNFWMSESAMAANVGAQVIIERCDSTGAVISTVLNSEKGTELPVTTRAAQNWTGAPTSTAFSAGDYIRVRVMGNDGGGTMASGNSFDLGYNGTTGGADGDSYITFTETIPVYTPPADRVPFSSPYPQLLAH